MQGLLALDQLVLVLVQRAVDGVSRQDIQRGERTTESGQQCGQRIGDHPVIRSQDAHGLPGTVKQARARRLRGAR